MSNQELRNQGEIKEEADVQNRRRFIKGAGIAAPVVLSLANRSAFGAAQPCLSQQISGNMSNVGTGSCESGYSPTLWKGPATIGSAITKLFLLTNSSLTTTSINNKRVMATFAGSAPDPGTLVNIVKKTTVATKTHGWYGTGFTYGVLTTTKIVTKITNVSTGAIISVPILVRAVISGSGTVKVGDTFTTGGVWEYTGANPANTITISNPDATVSPLPAAVCRDFTGGTTFSAAFGYGSTAAMRAILCADVSSEASHCIAALLNASFTPSINYVATVDQVKSLCATPPGIPYPPNYANLSNFFASTW